MAAKPGSLIENFNDISGIAEIHFFPDVFIGDRIILLID
jgi:hypothetical protein